MTAPRPKARAATVDRPPSIETHARDTAITGLASPGLLGPLPPAPRKAPAQAGLVPQGSGRRLAPHERARAEGALGTGLGEVRIHDGAAAAAAAESIGANGFALGDDVVLGSAARGTAASADLMLHELAHVAQVRTGAAPPEPLCDEPPRPAGIGRAPPREPFERGEGNAPESGHVLFQRDSATLDPGDLATIEGLMRDQRRRLWVDVYGFASHEGSTDYNANLSAHRAIAVRQAIEPLLPPGSLLDAHAHGETGEFASVEESRRVGIRIREAPELLSLSRPRSEPGLLDGTLHLELDPALFPTAVPRVAPPTAGTPGTIPPIPRLLPVPPFPLAPEPLAPLASVPPVSGREGVDWTALALSAADHGQSVDVRDAYAAEQMYETLYGGWSMFGSGFGDWAARRSVTQAYRYKMIGEHPNFFDRAAAEDAARGTSVHGLSIDLLDPPWAQKKKSGE